MHLFLELIIYTCIFKGFAIFSSHISSSKKGNWILFIRLIFKHIHAHIYVFFCWWMMSEFARLSRWKFNIPFLGEIKKFYRTLTEKSRKWKFSLRSYSCHHHMSMFFILHKSFNLHLTFNAIHFWSIAICIIIIFLRLRLV